MSSDDRDDVLLLLADAALFAAAVLVAAMLTLGCRSIIVDRERMDARTEPLLPCDVQR